MLVQCSQCGAPLDVAEGVRTVKCRYCGATNQLRSLKTIAHQTPPAWKPPPAWVPPPEVPAHSPQQTPLVYHQPSSSSGCGGVVTAFVALVVLGGGIAGAIFARKGGRLGGRDPAVLATLDVSKPRAEIARVLGTSEDQLGYVQISHPDFVAVGINGDKGGPVTSFYVHAQQGKTDARVVRERIEKRLGKRFHEGKNLMCPGFSMNLGDGSVGFVTRDDGTPWEKQREVAWRILLTDVLGVSGVAPPDADVRAYACGGLALADIAKIDPKADLDSADAAVRAVFPGAGHDKGGHSWEVPLAHPLFAQATLSWANAKGGLLEDVHLYPIGHYHGSVQLDVGKVAKCLNGPLGAGKETVTDYAKGKRSVDWNPKGGSRVYAGDWGLNITVRDRWTQGAAQTSPTLSTVIAALEACR